MGKLFLIFLSIVLLSVNVYSQNPSTKYRRSSLYSILIKHPEKEFGKDIDTVFRMVPIPEKYDNLNLKIRAINATVVSKNSKSDNQNTIDYTIVPFIEKNNDFFAEMKVKQFGKSAKRRF